MKTLRCYDTLHGIYVDVEVEDRVYETVKRSYWREHMQERRYNARCRELMETDSKPTPSLEDVVISKELKEDMQKAILLLNEKQRNVVVQYYYGDLTMQAIGNLLGISTSYVAKLLKQSLKVLEDYIQESGW